MHKLTTRARVYVALDNLNELRQGAGVTSYAVAKALNMPHSTVYYHLQKLCDLGAVEKTPGRGRGNVDVINTYNVME